jgi:hypothetical protein
MDLTLLKQKLLNASAFTYTLIDHEFYTYRQHLQTDKRLKKELVLNEIENLKR